MNLAIILLLAVNLILTMIIFLRVEGFYALYCDDTQDSHDPEE